MWTGDTCQSHPVRVRGLKHTYTLPAVQEVPVAPRAGAWVETSVGVEGKSLAAPSHPVRVRGLKHAAPGGLRRR